MYIYTCIHTCIHHTCIHPCMYTCSHAYRHMHMHIHIYIYMHMHIYVYTYISNKKSISSGWEKSEQSKTCMYSSVHHGKCCCPSVPGIHEEAREKHLSLCLNISLQGRHLHGPVLLGIWVPENSATECFINPETLQHGCDHRAEELWEKSTSLTIPSSSRFWNSGDNTELSTQAALSEC